MRSAVSDAQPQPAALPRSGSRTPRRSPSPAHVGGLENGLTKLSLMSASSTTVVHNKNAAGSTGAISKASSFQHFKPANKSRQPSDARNSVDRISPSPSRNPGTGGHGGSASSMRSPGAAGVRPKKSLSFSDSYLVSPLSSTSTTSSGSGRSSPKVSNSSSPKTSSASLHEAGRRIHVILPSNTMGGGGQSGSAAGDTNEAALESLKSNVSDNVSGAKSNRAQQQRTCKEHKQFETYMRLDELQQGLKRGELLEGVLRINPKNYQEAYISVPGDLDIFLGGILDRNRALNGDLVVVKLKPKEEWKVLVSDFRIFLARNYNCFGVDFAVLLTPPCLSVKKPGRPITKKLNDFKTISKPSAQNNTKISTATTVIQNQGVRFQKSDDDNAVEDEWASWERQNVNAGSKVCLSTQHKTNADVLVVQGSKKRRKRGKKKTTKKCEYDLASTAEVKIEQVRNVDKAEVEKKRKRTTQRNKNHTSEVDSLFKVSVVDKDLIDFESPIAKSEIADQSQPDPLPPIFNDVRNNVPHSLDASMEVDLVNLPEAGFFEGVDSAAKFSDDFATLWEAPAGLEGLVPNKIKEDGWSLAAAEAKVAIIQLEDLMLECGHEVPLDAELGEELDEGEVIVPPDELSEVDDSMSDNESAGSQDVQRAVEDARFFSPEENIVLSDASNDDNEELVQENSNAGVVTLDDLYYPGSERESKNIAVAMPDDFLPLVLKKLAEKPLEHFTVDDVLELPNGKKFVQPTAKVVYVIERKNTGVCRGYLKPLNKVNVLFAPTDHRMPRMMIPVSQCPQDFLTQAKKYANTLFIARLISWENEGLATGILCRSLDEGNLIENETDGILIENNIDTSEFSPEILRLLPSDASWTIPHEEVARRRDFRDTCVFTIDPVTARDLDDAVSCDALGDDLFHVGVHIADVAHFVREGSALDKVACHRATSVYLVQRVVPMLPRPLCENLCSLQPNTDRLTFSVEWVIRGSDGAILEEWFGHTIIRSCVQLSYEHAQCVIERGLLEGADALPAELALNGSRWTAEDVAERILNLHKLALLLRRKRAERGCLRLDQVKVGFDLDEHTGLPERCFQYKLRDSNRLIEEFMLLANVATARRIHKAFPQLAVLRRHPPPLDRPLEEVVESCKPYGIFLDSSSSQALQESLLKYTSEARLYVLTMLLSKPMNCAQYFCSGCMKDDDNNTWHYALNVPLYTHFTSPIRRYPDILVHRLLAATLGDHWSPPSISPQLIHRVLTRCNDMKLTAKRVSDLSNELYLAIYIKNLGCIIETAMVCRVLDRSFDVLVLRMGIVKRVFCEQMGLLSCQFTEMASVPRLVLTFPPSLNDLSSAVPKDAVVMPVLEITMFSVVQVFLTTSTDGPLKINAALYCPTMMTTANDSSAT